MTTHTDKITISPELLNCYFRDFTSPEMLGARRHETNMTGESTTFSQYTSSRLAAENISSTHKNIPLASKRRVFFGIFGTK